MLASLCDRSEWLLKKEALVLTFDKFVRETLGCFTLELMFDVQASMVYGIKLPQQGTSVRELSCN
jgi:hypothetical protein